MKIRDKELTPEFVQSWLEPFLEKERGGSEVYVGEAGDPQDCPMASAISALLGLESGVRVYAEDTWIEDDPPLANEAWIARFVATIDSIESPGARVEPYLVAMCLRHAIKLEDPETYARYLAGASKRYSDDCPCGCGLLV